MIETRKFSHNLPWKRISAGGLKLYQRQRLKQLANELASGKHGRRYMTLARHIDQYLYEDACPNGGNLEADSGYSIKRCTDLMAEKLVKAIEDGKNLRLVRCANTTPKEQAEKAYKPYCGIFVTESDEIVEEDWQSYIFTASESSDYNKKYVSLEVSWDGTKSRGLPRLTTKRWVNGFCFSDGYPQVDVVFPWPASLAR